MQKTINVAIFGGGIAGLAAAISLRRQGYNCRVYERRAQDDSSGMGFVLMPEGLRCLQNLGVTVEGFALTNYHLRAADGSLLHNLEIPPGTLAVRRDDLMDALRAEIPEHVLHYGQGLREMGPAQGEQFSFAMLDSGEKIYADFFVAADGRQSAARRTLFPEWRWPFAQVWEFTGMTRSPRVARWANRKFHKFHAPQGGLAVGILPMADDSLVWYMQFEGKFYPSEPQSSTAMRRFAHTLVGDWATPVQMLIEDTDFQQVHLWKPLDGELVPNFFRGNLVLVGDAAHPLLPFTSQGLAAALLDATTLAECVQEQGFHSAFATYSIRRRLQLLPFLQQGRAMASAFIAGKISPMLPVAQ